jgi:hypothetical protein
MMERLQQHSDKPSFAFFHLPFVIIFRAFSLDAVDSDDLDVYLTRQSQTKKVCLLFGSVERGRNTVKQMFTS